MGEKKCAKLGRREGGPPLFLSLSHFIERKLVLLRRCADSPKENEKNE